jgi:murein DD-endopeptidase MepM/ murein hydrolase activator NlpD
MRKLLLVLSLVAVSVQCSTEKSGPDTKAISESSIVPSVQAISATYDPFGIDLSQYKVRDFTVEKNESLYLLLEKLNLDQSQIYRAIQKAKEVIDVRSFKPDQTYRAYVSKKGKELKKMVWEPNQVEFVTFDWQSDSLRISRASRLVTQKSKAISGTINSSLYNAISDEKSRDELVYKLSKILAWQIDFFNLRKGDAFNILYENKYVEGNYFDTGNILAIELKHMGDTYFAYKFDNGDIDGYYDDEGKSVQKALLKAPFTYDQRISSGFDPDRFHPVLKRTRPHNGVDYAAPYGTPVLSVGDGTVSRSGYYGAAGRMVEVKYPQSYKAKYMHLSKFAEGVHRGANVKQGEVIGYVGNTGRVTGTHLHYGLYENGSPVNPLKIDLPSSESIPSEYMEAFEKVQDSLNREMYDSGTFSGSADSLDMGP